MDQRYLSAQEAAEALGVTIQTLYVYVGRKGVRSQTVPGSRFRKYWRADIDRILAQRSGERRSDRDAALESELTLLAEGDYLYRGKSALELAKAATLEEVCALLWNVDASALLAAPSPIYPPLVGQIDALLSSQQDIDRITAVLPVLEAANPLAYDLSPAGMARTGIDVLRSFAALTVRAKAPSDEPIHQFIARSLNRSDADAEMIRHMLVLAADHGFEPASYIARAVAGAGVSPWRAVSAGLSISVGRKGAMGAVDAIYRLLNEISESADPTLPIIERLRDDEPLPGFASPVYQEGEPIYSEGDPRGRSMLAFFGEVIGEEANFKRLKQALDVAKAVRKLEPNNTFMCLFLIQHLGLGPRSTLFHLGRAAGWIGHAIEQSGLGPLRHMRGLYTGPLPDRGETPRALRSALT